MRLDSTSGVRPGRCRATEAQAHLGWFSESLTLRALWCGPAGADARHASAGGRRSEGAVHFRCSWHLIRTLMLRWHQAMTAIVGAAVGVSVAGAVAGAVNGAVAGTVGGAAAGGAGGGGGGGGGGGAAVSCLPCSWMFQLLWFVVCHHD